MDYTSGPYTVTFPARQTTVIFNVPINDDDILERKENFILTINSSSLPGGVTCSDPGQATVTIFSDDCKTFVISIGTNIARQFRTIHDSTYHVMHTCIPSTIWLYDCAFILRDCHIAT